MAVNSGYGSLDELSPDEQEQLRLNQQLGLPPAPQVTPEQMGPPVPSEGISSTPGSERAADEADRQAGLDQIRARLMERIQGYDPEAMNKAQEEELANAAPGAGRQALSIIGSGLMGGAGKVEFANLDQQEAAKRKEILGKYSDKSKEYGQNLDRLQNIEKFNEDKANRAEDVNFREQGRTDANDKWGKAFKLQQDQNEREAAQHTLSMGTGNLDLQLKKSLFSDANAARDPSSDKSQNARDLVKQGFPNMADKINDKMSALDLKTYVDKLPEMAMAQAKATLAKAVVEAKPSEGNKALDKAFAKDYNDWQSSGQGTYQKNIQRLQEARDKLDKQKGDVFTSSGRLAGYSPEFLRSNESKVIQQDVQGAAQGALKATLGAQFTEKEGERIMANAYDPKLPPEENIRKIDLAMQELQGNADNMEKRGQYFNEKGSVSGYKPSAQAPAAPPAGQFNPAQENNIKNFMNKNKVGRDDAIKILKENGYL